MESLSIVNLLLVAVLSWQVLVVLDIAGLHRGLLLLLTIGIRERRLLVHARLSEGCLRGGLVGHHGRCVSRLLDGASGRPLLSRSALLLLLLLLHLGLLLSLSGHALDIVRDFGLLHLDPCFRKLFVVSLENPVSDQGQRC